MLSRVTRLINIYVARFCVAIFGAMVSIVFLQVVLRYVFHYGFPWAEELARYLQIWLTFLGACLAFEKLGHVHISFFVDRLPGWLRYSIFLLVQLITLTFLILLTYKGLSLTKFGWVMRSPGMGVPMSSIYLSIPFSFILMSLNVLNNTIAFISQHRGKRQ